VVEFFSSFKFQVSGLFFRFRTEVLQEALTVYEQA